MTLAEFKILFFDNLSLYICAFLFISIIIFFLYRKLQIVIIDPAFFMIIGVLFADSILLFLFFINEISTSVLLFCIFVQIFYFLGALVGFKEKIINNFIRISVESEKELKVFYIIIVIAYLLLKLYTYKLTGIPLFNAESRLDTFSEGGGIGILMRISPAIISAGMLISFMYLFSKKNYLLKIFSVISLFFFLITFFLDGSRSAVVFTFFATLFFCTLFLNKTGLVKKYTIYIFIFIPVFFIFSLVLKGYSVSVALEELVFRIIGNGDGYLNAFPNNVYTEIDQSNPFIALFADPLAMFRIYSWDDIPLPIGISLTRNLEPSNINNYGPNARLDLFAIVYFNFIFAIIISFILGRIWGRFRKKLLSINGRDNSILIKLLVIGFYSTTMSFISDPPLAFSSIINYLFSFVGALIPLFLVSKLIVKIFSNDR